MSDGPRNEGPATASRVTVWHHPRCSKSRGACAMLEERSADVEVRRYLDDPPTRAELEALLATLELDDVRELVRTGEAVYRELGLADASRDELLDAIVAHPILLQRPIVVVGDRAVIARPPERLLALLRRSPAHRRRAHGRRRAAGHAGEASHPTLVSASVRSRRAR